MNFLDLNSDCLSMILEKLDFDSVSQMRKTCEFFYTAPLTELEKKILKCGDFIYPREEEKIKCDHPECWELMAKRVESGKTRKIKIFRNFSDESFEFRYKLYKINSDCLNFGGLVDLFEYGIMNSRVDIVISTYPTIFRQLKDYYDEQIQLLEETGNPDIDFKLFITNLQAMYYKRALADFGYNFNICEIMKEFNIRDYPEWEEDEIFVSFYDMYYDDIDNIFQGYHLTI